MHDSSKEIEGEVLGFFSDYYGFDTLAADDDIVQSVGLDSVQFMELIYFLETRYSIKIPPKLTTVEEFGTVEKIAGVVANLSGNR